MWIIKQTLCVYYLYIKQTGIKYSTTLAAVYTYVRVQHVKINVFKKFQHGSTIDIVNYSCYSFRKLNIIVSKIIVLNQLFDKSLGIFIARLIKTRYYCLHRFSQQKLIITVRFAFEYIFFWNVTCKLFWLLN